MTFIPIRLVDKTIAALLTFMFLSAQSPSQQQSDYVFRTGSELVLVNVTVRDKNGKFVQGLKPEDFTILEDNKPQKVVSFDVENVDAVPALNVAQANTLPEPAAAPTSPPSAAGTSTQFKDRR